MIVVIRDHVGIVTGWLWVCCVVKIDWLRHRLGHRLGPSQVQGVTTVVGRRVVRGRVVRRVAFRFRVRQITC